MEAVTEQRKQGIEVEQTAKAKVYDEAGKAWKLESDDGESVKMWAPVSFKTPPVRIDDLIEALERLRGRHTPSPSDAARAADELHAEEFGDERGNGG